MTANEPSYLAFVLAQLAQWRQERDAATTVQARRMADETIRYYEQQERRCMAAAGTHDAAG